MSQPSHSGPSRVEFGPYRANLQTGELWENGKKIKLEGHPFRILALLLERPGELIGREELQQKLWPADTFVDFEHGINAAIKRLREALGDSAETPRYIETLPRRGYRFIHPVNGVPAVTALSARRRYWMAGLSALLATAALAALVAFNPAGWLERLFGSRPPITSVAILPLVNLTGDPSKEYFVDGIHDELITQLAQVSSLRVKSRTSVMRFKQQKLPAPEIAGQLGVEALLEGAVKEVGGTLRVTLQLIHGRSDDHLWAQAYQKQPSEVQLLQSEMVRDICQQLRLTLTPQEEGRLGKARPVNPDAYENYLRGKYHTIRGEQDRFRTIEYFNRAIAIDPSFAPAWQAKADAYLFLGLSSRLSPHEVYPQAKAAVLKALELDDSLAEAYGALGRVKYLYEWDWPGAEEAFRRAQELSPEGRLTGSNYLALAGRFDEAIAAMKQRIQRDPLSSEAAQHLGWGYFMAGRYDESIAQLKKAQQMDAGRHAPHLLLASNYSVKQMHAEAVAECDTAIAMAGQQAGQGLVGDCGWIYGMAGQRELALEQIKRLRSMEGKRWVDPVHLASIYDGLGEAERAIEFLKQAYQARSPRMVHLKVYPLVTPRLRGDPRFQELQRRVDLPDPPRRAASKVSGTVNGR